MREDLMTVSFQVEVERRIDKPDDEPQGRAPMQKGRRCAASGRGRRGLSDMAHLSRLPKTGAMLAGAGRVRHCSLAAVPSAARQPLERLGKLQLRRLGQLRFPPVGALKNLESGWIHSWEYAFTAESGPEEQRVPSAIPGRGGFPPRSTVTIRPGAGSRQETGP
jgi:hypothetical protein